MTSRERFEAWFNDQVQKGLLYTDDEECAWPAWQAAERDALEQAANTVDGLLDEFISDAQGRVLIDAANAIRALIEQDAQS